MFKMDNERLSRRPAIYPVELTTERLRLREMRVADAPSVLTLIESQPVYPIFTTPGSVTSERDAIRWIEGLDEAARSEPRLRYRLAIETLEGTLIGGARLHIDIPYDRQSSLGYGLGAAFEAMGYATEAAAAVLDLAFGPLRQHRVEVTIDPDNVASLRVAVKLGMREEGLMKERFRGPDGWHDSLLLAITEDEWRACR